MTEPNSVMFWMIWGPFLFFQNWSFTYVSRARNSGSLTRHAWAALMSNCVWFISFLFVVSVFNRIIKGEYGWRMSLFAVLYYTAFTMAGSIWAHHRALKKEKGLSAVGANKRFAQISVEEWANVKGIAEEFLKRQS